jgi:hypothetical protein
MKANKDNNLKKRFLKKPSSFSIVRRKKTSNGFILVQVLLDGCPRQGTWTLRSASHFASPQTCPASGLIVAKETRSEY